MLLKNSFKKKFLLFLAAAADYWYENFSYTASRYPDLIKCKKETLYSTVSRLLSVGEIDRIIKNGKVYLRLTSKGFNKLKQDIPLFKFFKQKWDGYWRMVIFDIPENRKTLRASLRRKLISLGLGQWQKSVYITPFPLEEEINQFLKAKDLFGYCFCMKAKRLSRGDNCQIASIAFKLEELNKNYYQFIDEDIEQAEFLFKQGKLKSDQVQKLVNKYLELISKDPGLPTELLPNVWWGEKAKEEFKKFIFNLKINRK